LEAYKNALRERKIPVDTSLILNTEATFEGGVKLATAILSRKERPSAIICVNDMVAIGAIITFQEYGIRIPDEVSVVGCDDIPLASLIRPSLTTIVQPKYEVGCLAAERLLGRMERKITEFKNISLPTQLQIRNSTSSLRPNLRRR
jgi:DNA-binding LacI/PurR family transcriptional regulator